MSAISNAIKAYFLSQSPVGVVPGLWSSPATWGGTVPQTNDTILIPFGTAITLDTTTNILLSLRVEGDLIISSTVDSWLQVNRGSIGPTGRVMSGGWTYTAGGIPVRGAANTRTHRRTHYGATKAGAVRGFTHIGDTPTANNGSTNDDSGINRGWLVEAGGQYLMNHATPAILATRVQGHLAAGTSTLILSQPVTWKAGDELLIPPTGFYDATKRTERRIIAADVNNGTTVTLTVPLGYARWGLLQYPTDAGTISLTQDAFTTGVGGMRATSLVPNVIDQRCKIFNLTRKLIIEGANDVELTNNGLGAHEMYMGASTRISVVGARYQNCGQLGLLGRYPIHFHMNAYNADGTTTTNALTRASDGAFAPGQAVIERCSFVDSQNRLHSAHGCKGVLFKDLIGDNIKGHAFFNEDGSEVGNTWDGCFVTRVTDPGVGFQLKAHDNGPSGWWINNLDNRWFATGSFKNGAADCSLTGVTVNISKDRATKPGGCWGASGLVPLSPLYTAPLQWDGMESHSNGQYGRILFNGLIDEQGNLENAGRAAATTIKKQSANYDLWLQSSFKGDFLWKNSAGGYGNNVNSPLYDGWLVVDNKGPDFSGNVDFGEIQNCLWVSHSLNNADSNPADLREGMQSYHGQLIALDSSVFGYASTGTPTLINEPGGRFNNLLKMQSWQGSADTYLFPFIAYFHESTNLRFNGTGPRTYINPGPSLQTVTPFSTYAGGAVSNLQGTNSHAYFDEWGTLFGKGAGRYGIIDHPSVTYGAANLLPILSADGLAIGNTSTTSPMIGFQHRGTMTGENGVSTLGQPLAFQRVDPTTLADQAGALITFACAVTPSGQDFMMDLPIGGWGRVFNPVTPSTRWSATNYNVKAAVQGLPSWYGIGIPVANTRSFTPNGYPTWTQALTKADLLAATTSTYWRDTTNEIVWVKYVMTNVIDQRNSTYNATGKRQHGYGQFYSEWGHS